jgi:hypothetical protein
VSNKLELCAIQEPKSPVSVNKILNPQMFMLLLYKDLRCEHRGRWGSKYRVKGQIRLPIRLANIVIAQSFFGIPALSHSVILGIYFFTIHKVSLHMGDTTMTIYHNGITKIHVIANDTDGARWQR